MNPAAILATVKKVGKAIRPAMDNATSALYLGSFLTAGKKEQQAKEEMRADQIKQDVKSAVTQRQADLIDKL